MPAFACNLLNSDTKIGTGGGGGRVSDQQQFRPEPASSSHPGHLCEHEYAVPPCLELRQHPVQELELARAADQVLWPSRSVGESGSSIQRVL